MAKDDLFDLLSDSKSIIKLRMALSLLRNDRVGVLLGSVSLNKSYSPS